MHKKPKCLEGGSWTASIATIPCCISVKMPAELHRKRLRLFAATVQSRCRLLNAGKYETVPSIVERELYAGSACWSARRDSIRGAQRALVGRSSDVPRARHSVLLLLRIPPELHRKRERSQKTAFPFMVRPEGFNSRRAAHLGRSRKIPPLCGGNVTK